MMRLPGLAAAVIFVAACSQRDAPTEAVPRLPAAEMFPMASEVIVAAGDIVCGAQNAGDLCLHNQTAALTAQINPTAVLVLGDNQYENGSHPEYLAYYDKSWGAFRPITFPVVGNHEYHTANASGYFDYFNGVGVQTGRAGTRGQGYHSTNIGAWHIVILNSNCANITGGCGAGSPQEQWLRADLAANPAACTLAAWHHPRFSSGLHGGNTGTSALWNALHDFGADVVLTGHDHDYERFAPQTHLGQRDDSFGIREFVVGTGGKELRTLDVPAPHSELFDDTSIGVLRMTLHPGGYAWRFLAVPGHTQADSGFAPCHDAPSPPPSNTPPVADFTVACQKATTKPSCVLDASPSIDDDGFTNLSMVWTTDVGRPTKTGNTATYVWVTWPFPNTFNVTLTATDAGGLTNSITKPVVIPPVGTTPPPPPPGNQSPVASFTITCQTAAPKHSCTLDASPSTDDGGFGNLTFVWTNDVGRPAKTGGTATFVRVSWPYPNTFNVTLTATDSGGKTAVRTQLVAIP